MDLEQALQTFFDESHDLLGDMERILLATETEATSTEEFNALFRAMHTIKGSAGLFGLDSIVSFTHEAENVLDRLRSGQVTLDDKLTSLLLRCHDHVKAMLAGLANKEDIGSLDGSSLLTELKHYSKSNEQVAEATTTPAQVSSTPATQQWLLSMRFGPDVLRNGMDPSSFIRYLSTQGTINAIQALCPLLPAEEGFDAETNYIRVEALFTSDAELSTIQDVFEFIREDSQIHVIARETVVTHADSILTTLSDVEKTAVMAVWKSWELLTQPEAQVEPSHDITALPPEMAVVAAAINKTAPSQENKNTKQAESKFIKVEASKLDLLINLIGELVIAGAAANLVAKRSGQTILVESTQTISNLIEQIRAGTLSMRMVQIGEIFSRFPRVVRDVARDLNKTIQLHISGADTELDKSMVDKLGDPLMHIVRNAMDHGLESGDARVAKGKPAEGNVWLNAYHESGNIVIEVADDGNGLHKDKIKNKAIERGLITAETVLSDQEIYKLIFEPGFSTAEQITNISGRGVGMDVVRKSIEQLRGSIDIDTELNVGTTFRIRLPLTLAIIDGFLVQIGPATFVVPLETVIECIEYPADQQKKGTHDCLNLRGELLPLLYMSDFLEMSTEYNKRQNVVVVRFGDSKAGLVVDELLGEFQTVIKPLGSLFRHLKAISGSTILGTGEVALILDVQALIQYATKRESEQFSIKKELARLQQVSKNL